MQYDREVEKQIDIILERVIARVIQKEDVWVVKDDALDDLHRLIESQKNKV